MPYYDQSMNLMNTGIASGQGGYNDGVYHDTPPNRYDRNYIFSKKSISKSFASNGYIGKFYQKHLLQCFQLYLLQYFRYFYSKCYVLCAH